jgi:hypothetical protein
MLKEGVDQKAHRRARFLVMMLLLSLTAAIRSYAQGGATVPPGHPPAPAGYRYVPVVVAPAPAYQPPIELPYSDGAPIPWGYHVEERPRKGLVMAGYILAGIPYGLSAMVAFSADFKNSSGYLMVPFAGPWLTIGRRHYSNCGSTSDTRDSLGCVADTFVIMGLIFDGLMQAAGGTMLLTGYLATQKHLIRNDVAVSMGPRSVGTGHGFGMSIVF